MTPRILFVEDEQEVLATLVKFFTKQGYEVHSARSGAEALDLASRFPPDIAVLDVMLHEGPAGPDAMDGFEICRALRESGFDRPVIFLTARTTEQDKLMAFELGGDDYVTKPFSLLELEARVEARLRRAGGVRKVFRYGDVTIDLDEYVIVRPDRSERLSNRERDLLQFLIEHKNQIVNRQELLREVWGYKGGLQTRTVDTHILTIRKKLGDNAQNPRFIETLHGVGYRWIGEEG